MERKSSKGGSQRKTLKILFLLLTISVFSVLILVYSTHTVVLAEKSEESKAADMRLLAYGVTDDAVKERYNPKIVSIKRGKTVYKVLTNKTDIKDILNDFYIQLDSKERLTSNTEFVREGTVIKIIRSEIVTEVINITIPYEVETIKTDKYMKGEENVVQAGVKGLKTQRIVNYFEDGKLLKREVVDEKVKQEAVTKIVEVGTAIYSLTGIDKKGYNCPYWYSVVDSGPYSDGEKEWLKFVMKCESGCNAESTKGYYKGLFQWNPVFWRKQYSENIFDGHAQIKHTVEKLRAGAATMWPACNRSFEASH